MLPNDIDISMFGEMPNEPLHLSVVPISVNEGFLSGEAILRQLEMELEFESGIARLPFTMIMPKSDRPCPAMVIISEEKEPSELVIQWVTNDFAVISLYYGDISKNDGSFKSGISAYISPTRRKKSSAGKLIIWAWAAIRALEYAEVLGEIDKANIGVMGCGIWGLSAYLATRRCPRFAFDKLIDIPIIDEEFVISNPHLFRPNCAKSTVFDN